jgi:transcriptional regulator with XRE-family HTH domain
MDIEGGNFLKGDCLRTQREAVLRASLGAIAARAGVTSAYLSAIEGGRRNNIAVDLVSPLAGAYELSVTEVLLGLHGITPEDSLMLDNAEASRIGQLVLSIDSDQRKTLLSLIGSMTEERPSEDGAQEKIPELAAA